MKKEPSEQKTLAEEIYPLPQEETLGPPGTNAPRREKEEEKKDRTLKPYWVILIIILGIGLTGGVIYVAKYWQAQAEANRPGGLENPSSSFQNLAQEQKDLLKAGVKKMRQSAQDYFNEHSTYVGWTGDAGVIQKAKEYELNIKIQGLTDKTYVVYSTLPKSSKLFCMDKTGFQGEINQLLADQTTCK